MTHLGKNCVRLLAVTIIMRNVLVDLQVSSSEIEIIVRHLRLNLIREFIAFDSLGIISTFKGDITL